MQPLTPLGGPLDAPVFALGKPLPFDETHPPVTASSDEDLAGPVHGLGSGFGRNASHTGECHWPCFGSGYRSGAGPPRAVPPGPYPASHFTGRGEAQS